ncbi:MAG: glycosyltransferase [Clostridia bacterium]|nr:glycosyltransferase [Clostridia bacterium]
MPKNLLFVVDNLVMGGITKVIANLLKNIDETKYNIDLLVLHYYEDMKVEIPSYVNIIAGNEYYSYVDESIKRIVKEKNIKKFFNKLKLVIAMKTGKVKNIISESRKRLLTKKYDTEIAFSDGFSHIFVANGDTPNKVAWMHTDVSVSNDSKRYYELVKESLLKMNICVCVSDKVMQAYKELYGIKNIQVIHNLMDTEKIINQSKEPMDVEYSKDCINLVSVGRLEWQKNFKRFANVHKRLIDDGIKINSYLIGDGIEKEDIKELVKKNENEDTFHILGRKENPFPYVKNADLFVLSSNLEGLPTVLYEAIILGVPCISTDVAGAKEILADKYGLVVENDDESLYIGLKNVLNNRENMVKYKENLLEYKFENSEIMEKIYKVI